MIILDSGLLFRPPRMLCLDVLIAAA